MKGVFQKALIVNLTDKSYTVEKIPDEAYEHFLGGKGLGVYLLLKKNKPKVEPFSPENNLIFVLGPTNDTKIWGSSRYCVVTKSPLTGIFSEAYSGGRVAEPMGKTGYDAIILQGISSRPVWLEISDEKIEFHDADDLWGKDAYVAEDTIIEKVGKKGAQAVVIGPAGENLVRFASIVNNHWRCAGRTGVGAVLGSKKVKGIAFYGKTVREPANPDAVAKLFSEWGKKAKTLPATNFFKRLGTPGLVAMINTVEAFPTKYWAEGSMEGWEDISAETLHSKFSVRARSCNKCFLACGRLTTVTTGKYAGLTIDGPEYETIYALGGLCLIKDLAEIINLNDICDKVGIDTITAGNLAAFAMEASARGKISEKIEYGDAKRTAELLWQISRKEGIGSILAEGIRHAAKEWGLEDIAIHVKGLEPAGYDPRYFKAMGLAYATSDRGACHMRTTAFRPELAGIIPPDQIEGKAAVVIDFEDRLTLQDALIICRFYRDIYLWPELGQIIEATTGLSPDKENIQKIACNIRNAVRIFNLREGMTGAEDTLPKRFFEEPIGSRKLVIAREDFEKMKKDYYQLRGWNERGEPVGQLPVVI
ncbi:MAG: aldehyde ferredoxin oxidoreductase family protein [Proteobacteria bacterium]|nr:aldehyde ferredoxin oxidoreductase family protein [Pseudomonadota bacterium]